MPEPKVRAEIQYFEPYDNVGTWRVVIKGITNENEHIDCKTKPEATLIARKLSAPDPIAIRQQAVREAIEIVMQKFSGYEETYVVKMKAEIVEAIDQLRNKGGE